MSKAKLLHITPLELLVKAIRKCYLSEGNSDSLIPSQSHGKFILGPKDKELVKRIIKSGHTSTLEHSLLTFEINISRGCLQELSRHRVGVSPSVQSTRYTLKKILDSDVYENMKDYIVSSGNQDVDYLAIMQLHDMKGLLKSPKYSGENSIPNDILKYAIPEALKIEEIISFNWRSFLHFLHLRTSPKAHWEIRQLANDMIEQIPEEYKFLIEEYLGDIND